MSFDTNMAVMARYVEALKRELPEDWHFVTILMAADPTDPGMHRIRVFCDREPTSLPELMRHLANDLEEKNVKPSDLQAPH